MKVSLNSNGTILTYTYDEEVLLATVLQDAGLHFNMPCGGNGTCGKCKIKAEGLLSPLEPMEEEHLTDEEIQNGIRLACRTYAQGDCLVYYTTANTEMQVIKQGMRIKFENEPVVSCKRVELSVPTLQNPMASDMQIEEATGYSVPLGIAAKLPQVLAQSEYKPYVISAGGYIIDVVSKEKELYAAAVDIGTTTIATYLYRLQDGELISVSSGHNAQAIFGADVISRIEYANSEGIMPLARAIREQLCDMFVEVASEAGIDSSDIVSAVITGNTTMLHLLCAIDPSGIATAPFSPATLMGCWLKAKEIELNIHPSGYVYLPRCMAAYVGADITTALTAGGIVQMETTNLLIDIGTNGEMALCRNGEIICCATAAGPAFEGASLHMGMAGITGAISKVFLSGGTIKYETIGKQKPTGICGSGIVDALAVMLDCGILDTTGTINEDGLEYMQYITEFDGMPAFLVGDSGVIITAKDIRHVQLAKSAIAAGAYTLMHEYGISEAEIANLYIAGGFGSFIDKKSAAKIGLYPPALKDKVIIMGNAAGSGASMVLLGKGQLSLSEQTAKQAKVTELSANSYFMEQYVECMMF